MLRPENTLGGGLEQHCELVPKQGQAGVLQKESATGAFQITTNLLSPVDGISEIGEQVCNHDSDKNDTRENFSVNVSCTSPSQKLIYKLTDTPPIHFLILFALQQSCLAISSPLGTAAIVAEAVCAQDEHDLKVKLLSSTMLMMGVATLFVTTFGVRLPVFQGPSAAYIIPLVILMSQPEFRCPETFKTVDPDTNKTVIMAIIDNGTVIRNADIARERINAFAGSLMIAGVVHCLLGLTGLVGVIARFVGPITIVPVVVLFGIHIHTVVVSFAETNWIVACITAGLCLLLSLLLSDYQTPIPTWTPWRGFKILWHPLHQTFALLFSIIVSWVISYIMTEAGALSDDPTSKQFNGRTDARFDIVAETEWFLFPYPGQFGAPTFSTAALVSFLVNTITSVLDSIGDYCATARIADVPPPPLYVFNRGVAVEGLMSFVSGSLGCGHATASFGENIGAMGITRVASRSVFQVVAVIYVLFAIVGKVGAFFIAIPYAVIGGTQIVTFGLVIGVILSYLESTDLRSTRNVSILGIAILLGMMVPHWCKQNPHAIQTGNEEVNNLINVFLSNPSFVAGVFACFMDNAAPGTKKSRGILVQLENIVNSETEMDKDVDDVKEGGLEVYRLPWIPDSYRKTKLAKVFPIFDRTIYLH